MIDLKILAIDTSGKVASVAVTDGEKLLWEKSVYTKLTHSQVILPMVKQALEETGLTYADLDCAAEIKAKYFADNENVQLASYVNRLQRASSLCLAVEAQPEIMVSADRLEVSYLQATKAEKDKAHRDK